MADFAAACLDLLVFFAGASIGSFVNVVAYRLPRDLSIIRPRSFCPNCERSLPAPLNVPIFSYLALRGRCHYCGKPIGVRYLVSELGLGVVALYLWGNFPPLNALARFALCAAMLAASFIDLDWRIIPDAITLPGIPAGLLAATFVLPEVGLRSSLWGLLAGGGFLFVVGETYRLVRGHEGMGMGDVKLIAMVGAFMGWPGVLFTIFTGSAVGAVGGVIAGLVERRASPPVACASGSGSDNAMQSQEDSAAMRPGLLQTAVPFGPFLSLAAAIFVLFQPQLIRWYLVR